MIRAVPQRIGVLAVVVLVITGCTPGAEPMYAELERPQTDTDLSLGGQSEYVDEDSIRMVGELDGRSFFLALPKDDEIQDGVCIAVSGDNVPDGLVIGCSGPNSSTEYPFGDLMQDISRIPDSALRDGWVRISDNLIFRPSA